MINIEKKIKTALTCRKKCQNLKVRMFSMIVRLTRSTYKNQQYFSIPVITDRKCKKKTKKERENEREKEAAMIVTKSIRSLGQV